MASTHQQSRAISTFLFVMLLVLTTGASPIKSGDSEMISIQNKTHTVCVSDDEDSPIFLDPPSTDSSQTTVIDLLNLEPTGWEKKKSQELFYEPVTDKRWEEFQTNHTNSTCFEMKKHVTLSVFNSPNIIKLIVDDDNFMEIVESPIKNENKSWTHYDIQCSNTEVYFHKNNELVGTVAHFEPTNFCFVAKNSTYYKLHNYKVWYSDTISTNLTELPSKYGCLLLYVSICPVCSLNILYNNNQVETISYSPDKNWQLKKINFGFNQQSIHLSREKSNQTEQGYWAIDIRQCPTTVNNKVIYSETHDIKEHPKTIKRRCRTLKNTQNDDRGQENAKRDSKQCDPGFLGKNCDVSCSKLLGEKRKYCEKDLVCVNDDCKCAWGYRGDFCEQPCDKGYWGFNCHRNCTENKCKTCDHITGRCNEESSSTDQRHSDPQSNSRSNSTNEYDSFHVKTNLKQQPKTTVTIIEWVIVGIVVVVGILISVFFGLRYTKNNRRSRTISKEDVIPREEAPLHQAENNNSC